MIKKISLILLLVLCPISILAITPKDHLDELLETAFFYYRLGRQKNYIAYTITKKIHTEQTSNLKEINIYEQKLQLIQAISDCVFLDKGTFGEHLSQISQKILSYRLADYITSNSAFRKSKFYLVNNPNLFVTSGHITAKCALALEHGDNILQLQGAAVEPQLKKPLTHK